MLSLVTDGQASNLAAQVTEILLSKLNWILTSAIGNELSDLAVCTMAAASTYALTNIDSSIAPSDKAWPTIATAYIWPFRRQGLDLVHAASDIAAPVRSTTPMQLDYQRLLTAVTDCFPLARETTPVSRASRYAMRQWMTPRVGKPSLATHGDPAVPATHLRQKR